MLTPQAAKAFENFDVVPCAKEHPFSDRLSIENLPADIPYRTIREIGEYIVAAAKEELGLKQNDIWMHGVRENKGWHIEIRSEDPLPHYKMQNLVQKIVTEKLMEYEAAQNAAAEEAKIATPPPALNM